MRTTRLFGFATLTAGLTMLLAVAPLGCSAPSDADKAKEKLNDKDPKVVREAIDEFRKTKSKDVLPQILEKLKGDNIEVREACAEYLEDVGDQIAVVPLVAAIDFGSSDKAVLRLNSKIADALGTLHSTGGTDALLKLLKTRDDLTKVHVVQALGKVADTKSTPDLIEVVGDETTQPLVVKYAIIALGELRAVESIPVLLKALAMERKGISFWLEASYSLFQIGQPAVAPVAGLLSGSDKAYVSWAESESRMPVGYASKAAIILADIGDPASIPTLVAAMKWKDPNGKVGAEYLVHGQVAEALGRLRAKEGANAIVTELPKLPEANMRAMLSMALARIGEKSVLPKMEAAAKNTKDSWTDRWETLSGIVMFGDAKQKPLLDSISKVATGDWVTKDCMGQASADDGDAKAARCKKSGADSVKFLADAATVLNAGEECKDKLACWAGKQKDTNPKVRERAAYELGKTGSGDAVTPLMAFGKDDVTYVRRAAYMAIDWLTRSPAAKEAVKAQGNNLAMQYATEKSSAILQIVNEDLKRVAWKVQHL